MPPGERAELAFILTLCRRTESLVEINWRAGLFQTVSMSRGYLNASDPSLLASVHTVIGTTPNIFTLYLWLSYSNRWKHKTSSKLRAVLNKMWVDMWIIYVSKNKGSCNFCFALKYSPVHSVKQQWWRRVYSIIII